LNADYALDPSVLDYIKNGEQVVDLDRNGLKLLQKPGGFCFGTDSVLLAAYAKAWRGERVVDLCCGSGVVPILMSARYAGACFYGVEIQDEMADMAVRNVRMNGLGNRISVVKGDIRGDYGGLVPGYFDVATVNPPYMKVRGPLEHTERNIARHELLCGMEDVAAAAAALLKYGGKLFLVHRTERLTDVLYALRERGLEPKTLRFVHPFADKPSKLFLMTAIKGASAGMLTEAPLIFYKEPGITSDEIDSIYYK